MMKREALERCMAQWQQIQIELYKMEVAAEDDELDAVPPFSTLKHKALKTMGVPVKDYPISGCYMCEYTLVDGVSDCLVCPLKGYAWEQCEVSIPSDRGFCNDKTLAQVGEYLAEFQSPLIGASVMT